MKRERLFRYRLIEEERKQIKVLLAQVAEREQELWAGVTSAVGSGDGMPRAQNAGHPDAKFVRFVSDHQQLSRERGALLEYYRAKLDALDAEQLAIEQAIEQLPDKARKVLRAKYFEGLSMVEIGRRYSYSRRQIYRIHDTALDLLEKI